MSAYTDLAMQQFENIQRGKQLPGDHYVPTHQEMRTARLLLAIEKLNQMNPTETRDNLIFEIENLISRINHLTAVGANSRGGGRPGS